MDKVHKDNAFEQLSQIEAQSLVKKALVIFFSF